MRTCCAFSGSLTGPHHLTRRFTCDLLVLKDGLASHQGGDEAIAGLRQAPLVQTPGCPAAQCTGWLAGRQSMCVWVSETRYGVMSAGLVWFLWGAEDRLALHKIQFGACRK